MNPPTPSGRDASSEATAATSARRSQLSADWLVQAARLEAMLDPVDEPLLAAAALRPGEAVVDIGCGRGPTARRATATVGALGRVMGVDVGEGVIDAARAIASVPEAAPLRWIAADAAALQLDERPGRQLVITREAGLVPAKHRGDVLPLAGRAGRSSKRSSPTRGHLTHGNE